MYPIVASDLDGTLLSPNHDFTDYTTQVLNEVTKKGIHFIFATGRQHVDVIQKKQALGIDGYMVTSNGALIHNNNGDVIFEKCVPHDYVLELVKIVKHHPAIYTHVFQGDDWFINKEDQSSLLYYESVKFEYQLFDVDNFIPKKVYKVFFTTVNDNDIPHLKKLESQIKAEFGNEISIAFAASNCLDVMANGVSKGNAVKLIAENIGYTLNDVMAFGDSMNDKEMLENVGHGLLMGNASEELKAALPTLESIGFNKDDAVAHYLSALYLNK